MEKDNDFETQSLNKGADAIVNLDLTMSLDERQQRRAYLITYSQSDVERFPTRESFSTVVVDAFKANSIANILQWACCCENHETGGIHYHLALKLDKPRRWKAIKDAISNKHNIVLHFSDQHIGYNVAYKYICKSDKNVLHSENHPNLKAIGSPRTKKGMRAFSNKRRSSASATSKQPSSSKQPKVKRLSNLDVAEFITKINIRKESELMSVASKRNSEGEKDLYQFILNKSSKCMSELMEKAWNVHDAPEIMARKELPRMTVLKNYEKTECVTGCNGQWLESARQVLRQNKISSYVFASAIRELLLNGRKKNLNILLVGPTNCGKSFLLNPLELMFKTFANPATGKYAWLGLDECELAYLNDFRWSAELIAWNAFLLLLEGQTVHLPRPKNLYANDMTISRTNTIPIFATSKGPIEYIGKYNVRDDRETDMMSSRWNVFTFNHQIPLNETKDMPACPHCFTTLVMLGEEE